MSESRARYISAATWQIFLGLRHSTRYTLLCSLHNTPYRSKRRGFFLFPAGVICHARNSRKRAFCWVSRASCSTRRTSLRPPESQKRGRRSVSIQRAVWIELCLGDLKRRPDWYEVEECSPTRVANRYGCSHLLDPRKSPTIG